VELAGRDEPVVLRVVPEERAQFGSEWRLMRNEYAAVPWLAVVTELMPRVLAGDLWTVNCMLDPDAPEPLISGVLDFDRAEFGDPAADWTIRMAQAKPDEREAFWQTYGALDRTPPALWRAAIYEARHLAAIRLERHRLGKPEAVRESYQAMAKTLAELS
jgi:aminoglycoside phosphotransferase (APT) family kinase protein